jgi:hypothetical protein
MLVGVLSRAWVKWVLHTTMAWLRAPRTTRCTISQRASGTLRCTSATAAARISHATDV